jgi:hypothetical protein
MSELPKANVIRKITASPARLGLTVGGVLLVALFASEYALGRLETVLGPEGELRDLRIAVVHCLGLGYLLAAYLYVVRGVRATFKTLRPWLDCSEAEFDRVHDAVGRYRGTALLAAALIGSLAAFAGPYITLPVPEAPWDPRTWSPEVFWHRTLGPVLGVLISWFILALYSESKRLSRLAGLLGPIDLLDLRPLAPFARQGLANALAAIGGFAVWSLVLLDEGFALLMVLTAVWTLSSAALALVMPLQGVHVRIRDAKQAELDWARDGIRRARQAVDGEGDGERGELADLAAYEALIERVREWPFDISIYVRLAFFLLLPLAAWIAGGLVEGLVEVLFF